MNKNKKATLIAALATIWNLLGLAAFFMHLSLIQNAEMMAQLPLEQQQLYQSQPTWYVLAFALAVLAGTTGSILLLMKKTIAHWVFISSLIGVLAQQVYMYFMSDTFEVMGQSAMIMPFVVLVIAIALVIYSKNIKYSIDENVTEE